MVFRKVIGCMFAVGFCGTAFAQEPHEQLGMNKHAYEAIRFVTSVTLGAEQFCPFEIDPAKLKDWISGSVDDYEVAKNFLEPEAQKSVAHWKWLFEEQSAFGIDQHGITPEQAFCEIPLSYARDYGLLK